MMILPFLLLAAAELPVRFEPNQGQVAGETEWIAHAPRGAVFITGNALAFATPEPAKRPPVQRMVGASVQASGVGERPSGGYSNYFYGRDEKQWRSGIPHYEAVRYADVYPGIDMLYYGTADGRVEYDFIVHPGADTGQIRLAFDGFDKVTISTEGDLLLWTGDKSIRQHRPRVLQCRRELQARYEVNQDREVTFAIDEQVDPELELTIDPVVDFITYFGGPGYDGISGVALDYTGAIYICGGTQTPANPTLNPFLQPSVVQGAPFVAKLTPDASRIQFFTAFPSTNNSGAVALALDQDNSVTILGRTLSPDFPLRNAFQDSYISSEYQGFIARLAADGRTLLYSSYFGGSVTENIYGLTLDRDGSALMYGNTRSKDLPIANAYQPVFGGGSHDCVLAKVSKTGSLLFSTYLGGSEMEFCSSGIKLDDDGRIYIVGGTLSPDFPLKHAMQTTLSPRFGFQTGYIARFSADGKDLEYSTFVGGAGASQLSSLAFGPDGDLFIGGTTLYGQFATKNALQTTCIPYTCGLVMRVNLERNEVLAATYLTGSGLSGVGKVILAPDGAVVVTGIAGSADFPTRGSFFPYRGGPAYGWDNFVARLSPDLQSIRFSTFFGTKQDDNIGGALVDSQNRILIVGGVRGEDLPATSNAFQPVFGGMSDGYLFRVSGFETSDQSPIAASPGQLTFRQVIGGTAATSQTVNFTSKTPLPISVDATAAWITMNPRSATTPVEVQVATASLAPGDYTAEIRAKAADDDSPEVAIPVTLAVRHPAPQLTSIEPSFVPIGANDAVITFHGTGFSPETRVRLIESIYSRRVTFIDVNTIQVTVPYDSFLSESSWRLSVVNPLSEISNFVILTIGRATPVIKSVMSAATRLPWDIAPGSLVEIDGSSFGPEEKLKVTIGGVLATVVEATDDRLLVVAPDAVRHLAGAAEVVIASDALTSLPFPVVIAAAAPGLFTADGSGVGEALYEGSPSPGGSVTLFGTGDGGLPIAVWIDGKEATVEAFEPVEGKPGRFQVRVTIPQDASTEGPVPVVLKAGDYETQPGVVLSLR